jgi:HPt (histidine-containing phosphotransfer) domain-containing protein
MAGERDKVLAAGMDDYLSKPLKPHALERMLSRYVSPSSRSSITACEDEPEAVESMADLDMGIDRTPRLSQLFIDHVPETLAELDAAIAVSDARRVREKAHKLKGGCLAVGAAVMAKLAETLQFEAERDELDRARERAQALRSGYERVAELLQKEMRVSQPALLAADANRSESAGQ